MLNLLSQSLHRLVQRLHSLEVSDCLLIVLLQHVQLSSFQERLHVVFVHFSGLGQVCDCLHILGESLIG